MRTLRPALAVVIVLAVCGLVLAACGGSDSDDDSAAVTTPVETGATGGTTLTATVGPGFEIGMTGTDGLGAGEYTIEVSDKSNAHNFHLTGPGVDMQTEVSAEEDTSWTVELQPGEYTFVCDPHESSMKGSFTVEG